MATVNNLVTEELVTLVKKSLDDIFRMSFHNAQLGTRSVEYKVLEQLMLDLFCNRGICDTLNAHIEKLFNTKVATNSLSKNLLTLSSFITPMTSSIRRRTDSAVADQNKLFAKTLKKEPVAVTEAYGDIIRGCQADRTQGTRSTTIRSYRR